MHAAQLLWDYLGGCPKSYLRGLWACAALPQRFPARVCAHTRRCSHSVKRGCPAFKAFSAASSFLTSSSSSNNSTCHIPETATLMSELTHMRTAAASLFGQSRKLATAEIHSLSVPLLPQFCVNLQQKRLVQRMPRCRSRRFFACLRCKAC